MSDYRYGQSNGGAPPAYGAPQPRGAGAPGAFFGGGGPPPVAMFPPRGPAFPPHVQARPVGPLAVPPMAMLARGFPAARGGMPPAMAIQRTVPQPTSALPPGWSEHFTPQGQRYYYNVGTGVSTYELPTVPDPSQARPGAVAATAAPTVAVTWVQYTDDASGQKYFYNTVTKATTWDEPEEYRMQQARVEVEKMKTSTEASGVVVAEEQKRKDQKKRQADEEAIKEFDKMPKDDRVAAFKSFLEEKQVSSQFKWQEALRFLAKEGLDKDSRWRFALSTVGEKKQAFSEYCTQVEKKQNIERRRQAKRVREEYLELLANVEGKVVRDRVTWDDLNDGAEFYGLRKDPRWQAIEAVKDKKDLFEGFVVDAVRKKSQMEAKLVEQFKDKFMAKLREKGQDAIERASFSGKRRLDAELKKKAWQYFDEVEASADIRHLIPKHDIYDWTELYLEEFKSDESKQWKAERENKKKLEEMFTTKLHRVVDEWLESEKICMNTSWKDIGESMSKECIPQEGDLSTVTLSERRQRRVYEKKIKKVREQMLPYADVVQKMLGRFVISPTTTFDEFSSAVKQGVLSHLEANKPEEGEEEEMSELEANPQAPATSSTKTPDTTLELAHVVQNSTKFPLKVKHAFQLLQYQVLRTKGSASTREPSRSPSPSSRKRRRSSLDSSRRSRSPSPRRSRSRSRSRSHNSRRRVRSRSQSRDPRAALAATSYGDLPSTGNRQQHAARPPPAAPVVDEAAKAEEIIRQARLKLLAKQQAKFQGTADSEPEEGEEIEDGEVEE